MMNRALCTALFLVWGLMLVGCQIRPAELPEGGVTYAFYEPLEDSGAEGFVEQGLRFGETSFPQPVIPVQDLLLRRSRPKKEVRRYALGEDFSLTSCIDRTHGVFVIYVGKDPEDKAFYPMLGHECFHLLNANLLDWYVEGLATVFSEELCHEFGYAWQEKQLMPRTRGGGNVPYRASYRMMRQMMDAYPDACYTMIRYTAPTEGAEFEHIDVEAWLASRSPEERKGMLAIIEPYAEKLSEYATESYQFQCPSGIGH